MSTTICGYLSGKNISQLFWIMWEVSICTKKFGVSGLVSIVIINFIAFCMINILQE
jgi:hypothetical protein